MSPTASELQVLNAHTSDVTSCDFSANYLLVTGSSDKTVRIWSWKPGLGYVEEDMSPLLGHKYGVTCVTFSPQGTMLASCSIDGTTILWSTKTGSVIHKFSQVNGSPVRVCRFNNDSCTLVTGGDNGVVCVWDIVHRTLLRTIQQHEEAVQSLAFTPDSSFLLTTCYHGTIKLYYFADICDTTQDNVSPLISVDDTHDLGVLSCDFSNIIGTDPVDPTCLIFSLVTSGNDQCLRLWKLRCITAGKNHSCKTELIQVASDAHSSSITCVKFNWSGDLVCSSSMDRTIKMWNSTNMNCLLSIIAHSRYINCISFTKNSDMLCTGSNDKTLKIWDLSGGVINVDSELHRPCKTLSHFGCGDLQGITMLCEEDIVLLKGDQDKNEAILMQRLENLHSASVNSVEFNSDGLLATGSGDKTIRLLEPDEDYLLYKEVSSSPFASHEYQVNGVTFMNSNLLASCSLDGSVHMWKTDENSGRPIRSLMSQQMTGIRNIKTTPDGKFLLASHDDGTAILWDLESSLASPVITYPEHVDSATCCSMSPDSRLAATASSAGDLKIYALPQSGESYNTEPIHVIDCAHDLGVLSMDFASKPEDMPLQVPENYKCHLLATSGNDGLAKIWKITIPENHKEVVSSRTPKEQRPFWMKSPEREKKVDSRIHCVEWRIYAGHGSNVTCVRFPANRSDLICTTSVDKQARIWSVYTSQCLYVLEHSSLVACCSFSRKGALLATGCLSGEICLWKLPRQLVFDTDPEQAMRSTSRNPLGWSSEEVVEWLKEVGDKADEFAVRKTSVKILANDITGRQIVTASEEKLGEMLDLDKFSEGGQDILQEVLWLRFASSKTSTCLHREAPHHLLCPITHCLMMQPVKCSDGFTYEKSAIQEWFLSGGKYVSPMTNQPLMNNVVTPNRELRKEIMMFLLEHQHQE